MIAGRRLAPVCAITLLLAGCASAPPVAETPWSERNRQLDALQTWQARGRLSLTTPEDSVQGSFEWRQRPDWVEIRFRGPLGAGGLFVYGPPGHLTAIGREGETVVLSDPEADLSALFGFGLPVNSLPFWLLGMADARYRHRFEFDTHGLPVSLSQRGWALRYSGWRELSGELLPRRLDLASQGLSIRILLDGWVPHMEAP